ncbi:hypothetical protein M422DRAFT_42067 [Sphaerobolus stellatus SS14]|nr:hypothetical protein M422DRAFT_42067 [Sphaerobolus stellatus SS14]
MTTQPLHALVLGGNGSLGSALMLNLRTNPTYRATYPKVTFVSRHNVRFKFDSATSPPQEVTYRSLDLSKEEAQAKLVELVTPNTVVFYAAFRFDLRPDELIEKNVGLLDNVLYGLQACPKGLVRAFVFHGCAYSSGSSVLGGLLLSELFQAQLPVALTTGMFHNWKVSPVVSGPHLGIIRSGAASYSWASASSSGELVVPKAIYTTDAPIGIVDHSLFDELLNGNSVPSSKPIPFSNGSNVSSKDIWDSLGRVLGVPVQVDDSGDSFDQLYSEVVGNATSLSGNAILWSTPKTIDWMLRTPAPVDNTQRNKLGFSEGQSLDDMIDKIFVDCVAAGILPADYKSILGTKH